MKYSLYIFFLLPFLASAQQTALVEVFRKLKTTEERCIFLNDSNFTKFDKPTFEAFLPIIEEKKDDKTAFFWYNHNIWYAKHFKINDELHRDNIDKMLNLAKKKGYKAEIVVAQVHKSWNDFALKKINEQQLYTDYLNYLEQIKQLGLQSFRKYRLIFILHEMGRNFYQLGDYEKALEILLMAEKIVYNRTHIQTLILNLLETIYAENKDYERAIAYAQKIYTTNEPSQYNELHNWVPIFWQGLSSLDIAQYMLEMGNFKESEMYADRGYKLYKTEEDFNNTEKTEAIFEALQVLIKIKLIMGKVSTADTLLKKVEVLKQNIDFSNEKNYFKMLKCYQNYVKYFEVKKDYTNAYRYIKLTTEMQDSLVRRNDKRKLWQTEMQVKIKGYQQQIETVEEENILQAQLRNIAIAVLLFSGSLAFVIYHRITRDNRIITQQKALLEQSLAEKENLLKEIHHRVKNNLQIISGIFDKQARLIADETTKKLLKEGQNRVFSIALVHQNLYQTENLSSVNIKSYLEILIKNIAESQQNEQQNINITLDVDDSNIDVDTLIPLGLILNELITNCYKYAFKDRQNGDIFIRFRQNKEEMVLSVKDNGVGLPDNIDIKNTRSLGMNLVRGLTRQIHGRLDFKTNTEGTEFTIYRFKN